MNMPAWLKNAIFYEIYPQSFYDSDGDGIGDLQGIIQKLDYIAGLGCNAIWLNPCFASPFKDAGYDVSDYCKIAPRYGTNDDARMLFEEAHRRGMHVLLDLVPGHTSDRHKWFRASAKPKRNKYSDRYVWTDDAFDYPEGFRVESGLYDRNGNYLVNFFSSQPALNYGFERQDHPWQLPPDHPSCVATLEAIKDVMRFWLDMGCDGFRVDMAKSLVKNDEHQTGIRRLWQNVRDMLDREYPQAVILSEWSMAKDAVDAGFHLDFYIHFLSKGYNALFQREGYNYVERGKQIDCFFNSNGRGNIRAFTDEYMDYLAYIAGRGHMCLPTGNHDMIRYSHLRTQDEMKIVAAFIMLLPSIPFIYYGDEIGLPYAEGIPSKEGGYYRTGSRTPMQWTGGKNRGFSQTDGALYLPVDESPDSPDVERQQADPQSLLNTFRRFAHLRASEEQLQAVNNLQLVWAKENEYPFVFRRGKFLVAVNPRVEAASAEVPCGKWSERARVNGGGVLEGNTLTVAGISLVVYEEEG